MAKSSLVFVLIKLERKRIYCGRYFKNKLNFNKYLISKEYFNHKN